jgi:hypothetical protein
MAGPVSQGALNIPAGATANVTGPDQTNQGASGVKVVLDMTVPGTGSVTLTIQGKDPGSGKYFTALAGTAVTTVSTNVYTIYPGITAAANAAANDALPYLWRVIVTANNANPCTYTVGWSTLA